MTPAAKSDPMDVDAMMPYRIKGVLGGISVPSVPPQESVPPISASSYLFSRMMGFATEHMVAVVAPREPQIAPMHWETT